MQNVTVLIHSFIHSFIDINLVLNSKHSEINEIFEGNRRSGKEKVVSYTFLFYVFALRENRNKNGCIGDSRMVA